MKLYTYSGDAEDYGLFTLSGSGQCIALFGGFTSDGTVSPPIINKRHNGGRGLTCIGEIDWKVYAEVICDEVGHNWKPVKEASP